MPLPAAATRAGEEPRSLASLVGLALVAGLVTAALLSLGTWQVHRRAWKLDLIARVDARVHAQPMAPPGPSEWPTMTAAADEYRHVVVRGTFLGDRQTMTQAVTDDGPGFWDMVPLRTADGWTVLVNRGFVPTDLREAIGHAGAPQGDVTVTGLLRLPEIGGGFLRSNDPAADHWYSRDVAAIAARRGLGAVAPYFIDAGGSPAPGPPPIGGLTVVRFPNNHLVYAITWYGLALMLIGATLSIGRDEWRRRHGRDAHPH